MLYAIFGFSTKGQNRGLGIYSMRLLSPPLDGDVIFKTSKEEGTLFIASLQRKTDSQVVYPFTELSLQ